MSDAPRDWDARSYGRVAGPVQDFGHRLLERLDLDGDEVVLDAGCGDGAVTADLLERLPRGRVVAVDASPSMVEAARRRLGSDRARVLRADLLELELDEPVDVVFSSATFHWIADHDLLFSRLQAAVRPGGRLLAQCGAKGNAADVAAAAARAGREPPYAAHLGDWPGPWHFPAPEEARARLERAGFERVEVGTHVVPVTPGDPEEYLRTMVLGPHIDRLPGELRQPFVARVAADLGQHPTIDYVRLTLSARRPEGRSEPVR